MRDVRLGPRDYKLLAVFDGHDGRAASEFCVEKMVSYLKEAEKGARPRRSRETSRETASGGLFLVQL